MTTERPSPRYADIDVWAPMDILDAMIEGQFGAVAAVRAARPSIERAVLAMEARLENQGRLVYAGAGTSGRLAVQDGAELMPTFGWPRERTLLLIAGGSEAMTRSVEGAEDEPAHAAESIYVHAIGRHDVLIAVAASGTTPFTVGCLRGALASGALTIGIANNPNTPLLEEADCAIYLDTGAEPIAGSTRMNAGTAQRVTLNLLSSILMIRLGRVYRGHMVDVQASNAKLARRKESMLVHLAGRTVEEAREALIAAQGNVKLAMLLLEGCSRDEAQAVLTRTGGRLRAALSLVRQKDAGSKTPQQARIRDLIGALDKD